MDDTIEDAAAPTPVVEPPIGPGSTASASEDPAANSSARQPAKAALSDPDAGESEGGAAAADTAPSTGADTAEAAEAAVSSAAAAATGSSRLAEMRARREADKAAAAAAAAAPAAPAAAESLETAAPAENVTDAPRRSHPKVPMLSIPVSTPFESSSKSPAQTKKLRGDHSALHPAAPEKAHSSQRKPGSAQRERKPRSPGGSQFAATSLPSRFVASAALPIAEPPVATWISIDDSVELPAETTESASLLEANVVRSHVAIDIVDKYAPQVKGGGSWLNSASVADRLAHFRDLCDKQRDRPIDENMEFWGNQILGFWSTLPGEIIAVFALLPILDPVSDLSVFNQLVSRSYFISAAILLLALIANWRFVVVYTALTPTPTRRSLAVMFCPFAMFVHWSDIMGKEVTDEDLDILYEEAGLASPSPMKQPRARRASFGSLPSPAALPSPALLPPPTPPASPPPLGSPRRANFTRLSLKTGRAVRQSIGTPRGAGMTSEPSQPRLPRYGTEAARVKAFIERHYDAFGKLHTRNERLAFLATFEAKLTGLSVVLGPFLLWRAALTLAHSLAFPTVSDDFASPRYTDPKAAAAAKKQCLYSRVLTFVEATCESIPQVLLQSVLFYGFSGSIDTNLYIFSAACSLGTAAMALITFAQHHDEVLGVLIPTRAAYAAQVASLCNVAQIDPAALLAAIVTARANGVAAKDLRYAVLRMKQARVMLAQQSKAKGSSTAQLKQAGILTQELHDAGHSAAQLKTEGHSLTELEAVGYTLGELRDAGYTAGELFDASHTLAELKMVGFSCRELRALGAFSVVDLKEVGFGASELKAVLYSATELLDAGFTLEELKISGFTLKELQSIPSVTIAHLKKVGFGTAQLKAILCTATELRHAGFSKEELHKVGYSLDEMAQAGYGAHDLRSIGYSAVEMKQQGFSAAQLKQAKFTVMELRAAGYSIVELKQSGCGVRDLTNAGCGASEMREGGFQVHEIRSVYTPAELRAAGYTAGELRAGGITAVSHLKAAGYTAGEMREAGYNAATCKAAGFVLAELKVAGYTATQMKPAGYTLGEFKSVGCSSTELRDAGFSATQMRNEGYTAAEQKVAGYTATDLKASGYSAVDLKSAGYSAAELKAAGYTTADLRSAMYTAIQLKAAGYSAPQMKAAGFSLKELKKAGYVLAELKTARYTAAEMKASGYEMEELKAAGYLAAEMKLAGFSANVLRGAGYTLSELKGAGFDATELKSSGCSAKELTIAGYSITQIKQSGFKAKDCKLAGYSAAELRSSGFTLQQLMAEGVDFTTQELMTAGFSAAQLRVLTNTLAVSSHGRRESGGNTLITPANAIVEWR